MVAAFARAASREMVSFFGPEPKLARCFSCLAWFSATKASRFSLERREVVTGTEREASRTWTRGPE